MGFHRLFSAKFNRMDFLWIFQNRLCYSVIDILNFIKLWNIDKDMLQGIVIYYVTGLFIPIIFSHQYYKAENIFIFTQGSLHILHFFFGSQLLPCYHSCSK